MEAIGFIAIGVCLGAALLIVFLIGRWLGKLSGAFVRWCFYGQSDEKHQPQ